MIRIVIADDHAMFRDGLRELLESEPDFRVVGQASDGEEAAKLALQLKPDILLLDLAMPRSGGLEALRELRRSPLPVRTILLAAVIQKTQAVEAFRLGAHGLLLKDSTTQVLQKSIRSVMAGEFWLERGAVSNVIEALRNTHTLEVEDQRKRKFGLTRRELEVIAAIVVGCSNKDIGQRFSITEDTVKHHLTNIFDKLGVSTRLELALFAVSHRLVGKD